jgi:transcriptional regulator with XRE-family HTH domain
MSTNFGYSLSPKNWIIKSATVNVADMIETGKRDPQISYVLRQHLNRSFIAKCESNPNYSLRAYARDLEIDPTLLSRLMKGERSFSKKMTQRLLAELNLPLNESIKVLETPSKISIKGHLLTENAFSPISKWYFFVILDLFLLPDFKSDAKWISQRIGLSQTETNAALQVLTDSGHINTSGKVWVTASQNTTWTNFTSTTRDRQNYQKQLLDKAKEAIDSVDFDLRENASLTLAASTKLIPEIKKRIQKFKNELRDLIESTEEYDEVFQVIIGYFPLTQKSEGKQK